MSEDLHRRFGVDGNNETWRLLAEGGPGPETSDDERARFLYRAYSSAYHWMETPDGTKANWARGEHLVARAAIAVGLPDVALMHATRCRNLCLENPDIVEDWDLAFAEEAIARAHAALGNAEQAIERRVRAAALGAAIAEEEDRAVFEEELAREPWFGLDDVA